MPQPADVSHPPEMASTLGVWCGSVWEARLYGGSPEQKEQAFPIDFSHDTLVSTGFCVLNPEKSRNSHKYVIHYCSKDVTKFLLLQCVPALGELE